MYVRNKENFVKANVKRQRKLQKTCYCFLKIFIM